jgi:hypothetical protein
VAAVILFFFVNPASIKSVCPRRAGPGKMFKAQGTATATAKAKIEH